jgi:galactokinase
MSRAVTARDGERASGPVERAVALYRSAFGADPARVASAPGRVNLIGEHVDYHGGHVLPVATEARTAVAVGPRASGLRTVAERGGAGEAAWPPSRSGTWSDYPAGVAKFLADALAEPPDGIAVAVAGDVPLGAGLSSSAALEVATAAALAALWGLDRDPRALAAVAHRAETDFVGVPCGVMDQMAAAMAPPGRALLIDCATLAVRSVSAGTDLVVVDSGESHALRDGAYAERRREGDRALALVRRSMPEVERLVQLPVDALDRVLAALPPPLDRRVRHVVEEDRRTVRAAEALDAGDVARFGALVDASHDSLRDLYECSTPRLDAIVAAARRTAGVLGARLVGAGWGGSVLVVVERGRGPEAAPRLAAAAAVSPDAVRVVRPGHGVSVER